MTTRSAHVPRVAAHGRGPLVLGDVFPARAWRDAALVCSGAALTALGAQISMHIPPSPVPVTGQTLGVVLAGAALGARRGAASQALYLLLGFLLPIYADGASGPSVVWGATGGYLVGFVLAAWVIGRLAELGADRRVVAAVGAFTAGQLIVFGIGVPCLKVVADMPWAEAIHDGFTIFIAGGLIKALIAGVATPLAWRAVRRVDAN